MQRSHASFIIHNPNFMPQVPINYLALLGAAIASMVVGAIWYGPLFGKPWMALSGMSQEKINAAKPKIGKSYALMFAGSLVMSYVLAHALVFANAYLGASGASSGVMTGFWNWIGFIAPATLGNVIWEGKPWKLWILNNGYYLVSLSVMGVILAVWM